MKMRIGLFSDTYTPEINGVVSSIVTLQKELEKNGHEVFIVTTASSALHIQKDGNILRLPGMEIKKLYGYRMSAPFHVVGLGDIKAMNLDVIHAHTEFGIGIFARIVGKLLNIPLVATYHTMYEDYTHYVNFIQSKTVDKSLKKVVSSLSRMYGDACAELIAPSQKTKNALQQYGIKKEIHVIPTGLQMNNFDAEQFSVATLEDLRRQCKVRDGYQMLLFVGRIAAEKDIDIILQAQSLMKKENIPVHTVIVGGGPDMERLQELAQTLDILDVCTFAGRKPSGEVPLYYAASDFFVSASLTETQGLTFIEAMAASKVVFAQEREIMEELILEDETGYYFIKEAELVEKIKHFLRHSDMKRKEMSKLACQTVAVLNADHFYTSVIAVYEKALTQHKDLYTVKQCKRKHPDYYEITVENEIEEFKLLVGLETLHVMHLEKDVQFGKEAFAELLKENDWNVGYYGAVKFLTIKDRTRKEMYDYLSQKTNLDIANINLIIEKFEVCNYINDARYLETQLEGMKTMLMGRRKIIATLVKKGIPHDTVVEALDKSDDRFEILNALKLIDRSIPGLKDKNARTSRAALEQKLYREGFNQDTIEDAMSLVKVQNEEEKEQLLLQKDYQKYKERYGRNYEGYALNQRVFQALLRKGYRYEHVSEVMSKGAKTDEIN